MSFLTKKNYWNVLTEDILKNRNLMILVLLVTVLCFGFTITNFSIGVDDPARVYYLYSSNYGNMIQQGRLLHVAVNQLTRSIQFIPFFTDFVGAALYAFSALLYCALFQYITNGKLSSFSLISFCCVYISSSVLAEKYIYHLDVIVTLLSYCCSAVALLYAFRFVKEKHPGLFLSAVAALMCTIASYESFVFLYISGVFGIFILEMFFNRDDKTFLNLLLEGLQYALILLVSAAVYYFLVYIVQVITEQHGIFVRYNFWLDNQMGIGESFVYLTKQFYQYFQQAITDRYLPILVFCLFSVLGFVLLAYLSIREKNVWLFACFAALWFCNFGIHYITGNFFTRAAQTFCFFSGFALLLLIEYCGSGTVIRKLLYTAVILLVFVQSADMNRWFYNDYVRYRKEAFAVNTIATRLVAECDISKPVVFTNYPEFNYFDTELYPGKQVNGNSVISWSIIAFNDKTQPFVAELFRMHGYDFVLSPTPEMFDQAHIEAESMPTWPQQGCIREFPEFIIVNF